jgi:hypothetical protein
MKQTQPDFSHLAKLETADLLQMQTEIGQSPRLAKAWTRAFARAQSGVKVTPKKDNPAVTSWHRAFEKAGATRR